MATLVPLSIRRNLDVSPAKLAATIGRWPNAALLESGPGFGKAGRWSIFAARPRMIFEAVGTAWSLVRGDSGIVLDAGQGDPLVAFGSWLERIGLDRLDPEANNTSLCPFQTGLIGYHGYDLAPLLERLPRKASRDSAFPDLRFGLYDTAITFDHQAGIATIQADDLLDEGREAVESRVREWLAGLRASIPPLIPSRVANFRSNFETRDYLRQVRRALEYINAGDVFQINLSQRFEGFGPNDPLDLYTRLKARSAAPFSGFYRFGDLAIVSASPEWFYSIRGDQLITRPIKGTRPRSTIPEADAAIAADLLESTKDRAELTMIVDLERNDVGRVCRFGTVKVRDPLSIESFPQVHHLVATVEGRLRDQATSIDVLRAMFPGGSITGAPKIRAMEIIDELEPTRRGVYTGALGYISQGASAFNLLIRTILVEGDRVRYQVGGGIVADSDPLDEYEETLHKGRGLREVLEA